MNYDPLLGAFDLYYQYKPIIELGLLLLAAVVVIAVAFLKELLPYWTQWRSSRTGFSDSQQTSYVRGYATRLGSRRRERRVAAVQMLAQMNDHTAVPALVRALERYKEDGPFVEMVVRVLGQMGDERALPALKGLTRGRHLSLMQAAREAVQAMEPRTVLLRSSSAPGGEESVLLRPARGSHTGDSQRLLRAETRE